MNIKEIDKIDELLWLIILKRRRLNIYNPQLCYDLVHLGSCLLQLLPGSSNYLIENVIFLKEFIIINNLSLDELNLYKDKTEKYLIEEHLESYENISHYLGYKLGFIHTIIDLIKDE